MALSSNSLFHFTEDKSALLGILADNFRLGWCKESYETEALAPDFYVPMVSFCDIPLSQIKRHIGSYGPYGIGLTKSWAIRNGLNPVIYMQSESMLNSCMKKGMAYVVKEDPAESDEATNAVYALANFLGYVKPYEGELTRKGVTQQNYRYSDEREWRYVPTSTYDNLYITGAEDVGKEELLSHDEASFIESFRLHFDPNDIKYIIIRDDSEIREFMRHLDEVKGGKYSSHDLARLSTRFLTVEQIEQDI